MYESILHEVTRIPTGQTAFLQALAGAADRWANLGWQTQLLDEQRRRWDQQMALEQARYQGEMAIRQMLAQEQAKYREAETALRQQALELQKGRFFGGMAPNPDYYDYRSAQEALAGPLGVPDESTPDQFAPSPEVFVPGYLQSLAEEREARAKELQEWGQAALTKAGAYAEKVEADKNKPRGGTAASPKGVNEKDFLNYYSLLQHAYQQGAISGPLPSYEDFKANFSNWAPTLAQVMPKPVGMVTDQDLDRALKGSVVASMDNATYYRLPDGSITDDPEVAKASILRKWQDHGVVYQGGGSAPPSGPPGTPPSAPPSTAPAPRQSAPSQPVGVPPQLGGRRDNSNRPGLDSFFVTR
jgi:hypothetical protein